MGGTKRMAELVLQALAKESKPTLYGPPADTVVNQTRFTMVRFGNVLGSSGSVIRLFKQQIRKSGPVTVTHREITRYFMTIPEAAQIGSAHVCTPVTKAHLVCRLLLAKKKTTQT